MRFDRRFFFVLGASLVWGLLVAAVFYRVAGTGSRVRAEAQKAAVVAAKELPAGATMDRASVKLRMLPESLFPAGGFARVEDVLDRPSIAFMPGNRYWKRISQPKAAAWGWRR